MSTEMNSVADNGMNWAGSWLTIGDVCHFLAFDSILLSGEGKGDVGGRAELNVSSAHNIK